MILVLSLTVVWIVFIILCFIVDEEKPLFFVSVIISVFGIIVMTALWGAYPIKTEESMIKSDYTAIGKGIALIKVGNDETVFTDYNTVTNITDTSTFIKTEDFNMFNGSISREYKLKDK